MTQEALKDLLDVVEAAIQAGDWKVDGACDPDLAIRRAKQALAQTQEPVAWAEFDGEGGYHFLAYENNEDHAEQWDKRNPNHVGWVEPLYTTPPQREPLTDKAITQVIDRMPKKMKGFMVDWDLYIFARAIEAAHGIKENT